MRFKARRRGPFLFVVLACLIGLLPGCAAEIPSKRACTATVSSAAAAETATANAAPGAVICLTPGKYGKLTLTANGTDDKDVLVRPQSSATIAGASLDGKNLTLG